MLDFIQELFLVKVDNQAKYKLIFSVHRHPNLGVMVHPYVVEYTSLNTLSLTYQKLFSGNATHYTKLTSEELDLIKILDPLMVEHLIKKFSPVQKIRPKEFFRKHFTSELRDQIIRPYIEKHLLQFLDSLGSKEQVLYEADDINPAAIPIAINTNFTKVLFHFRRNENGTSYFVTLKHDDDRIPFMKQGAVMLTTQKARMIVHGRLYKFYDFVDGKKLAVFLHKKYVHVKPESERTYYSKFVRSLMETAPVFAQGFEIETLKEDAKPILVLSKKEKRYGFDFLLKYSNKEFKYSPNKLFHVAYEWKENEPYFKKYRRSTIWEENRVKALYKLDLKWESDSLFSLSDGTLMEALTWIRQHRELLEAGHFELGSSLKKAYSFETASINYEIKDKIDWFDLNVIITIGEFKIPFKRIVKAIKQDQTEIELPNGELFVFPKEWFALGEALIGAKSNANTFSVKKYQVDILGLIKSDKIKQHLTKLVNIKKETPHTKFNGTLRSYQVEGLSWLMFLRNNRFGGILADDMGLGKTVQTLAFIQKLKYQQEWHNEYPRFLLVAPTSLLYNWKQEAAVFTPDLSVHLHAGPKRVKDLSDLKKIDVLVISYGLVRNDALLFEGKLFEVIMLDESQNIKNHTAKTTQYINSLTADCRVALTGTPIENTVKDLWSQMNFLNKGLLGSLRSFEDNYVKSIEKKNDKEKADELQKRIKPFLLRRTKAEVASDLPPVSENIIYCELSSEQKEQYEEVKSAYRNSILEVVEKEGLSQSKFSILQGLSKLRQLANHPKLVDKDYKGTSGKHLVLLEKISTAISDNHKVLVFSQFVSYLKIIEKDLIARNIDFFALTGSTPKEKRAQLVADFQEQESPKVFLISLKAGGTGFNLTSADYVFIVDPWWNPAAEAQARDRTHRIGQTQAVFSYKFISVDTIEEKIVSLQQKKQRFSKDIIVSENNVLANLDINELQFLLA